VKTFPTVSVIDLGLILSVVDDILNKIGFVVRFIGGFSIITGLVVLIASVIISKYQRMRETVLLRTLGATGRQILVITALEYFFLGALAAITGIMLAICGAWALARFSFKTTFTPSLVPIALIFFGICSLTVLIGLFNSREVLNRPPLEVLQNQS
jgi:putative ABC transport system permease protein